MNYSIFLHVEVRRLNIAVFDLGKDGILKNDEDLKIPVKDAKRMNEPRDYFI